MHKNMHSMHLNMHNMHLIMHNMHLIMHSMHVQGNQTGGESQTASDCRTNVCDNIEPLAVA